MSGASDITIRAPSASAVDARGARRVLSRSSGRISRSRARGLSSPASARASAAPRSRLPAMRTGPGGFSLPAQNPDHERRANDLMTSCHLQKPASLRGISLCQEPVSDRQHHSLNQPDCQFVVVFPSVSHLRASKAVAVIASRRGSR